MRTKMKEFEFTLKFLLPKSDENAESHLAKLERTCSDALVGIGKQGRIALQFNREAKTAMNAVYSAVKHVRRAIKDVKLIEATPDLVGITDIAEHLGFTRQNMRKLIVNNASFPAPIHEGKTSLWHLASVLEWLEINKAYEIDQALFATAKANMQINIAKEISYIDTSNQEKLFAVFDSDN